MSNAIAEPEQEALVISPEEEARAIVESRLGSEAWQKINRIEEELERHPDAFFDLPTNHLFPGGLYVREVFMRKGDLLTTRVHMVEHAFIVSRGAALVWSDDSGWVKIEAHHSGITKPGTRRLILILEDMLWTTVHPNPNNETDPEKIVDEVTYAHYKLRLNGGSES